MHATTFVLASEFAQERRWTRVGVAVVSVIALLALALATAPAARADDIVSDGPLNQIGIHETLNCTIYYAGDAHSEVYGDMACGTFVATGGKLYGPSYIPAGSNLGIYDYFVPVSQSLVTGSGTLSQPYKIKTVVELAGTGLKIVELDSYVVGQESYRTDVTIQNSTNSAQQAVLYRAADCYLQNSDYGFGSYDGATGGVACVEGEYDSNGILGPGDRIEQWLPLSSGSNYLEAYYGDLWAAIATQQPFPNTGRFDESIDNGAGLSWTVTVPPQDSITRSHLTTFSPQGQLPLTITKTADALEVEPGGMDGYSVTVTNPNQEDVSLDSITDLFPSGFSYRSGSTSGSILTDPSLQGDSLVWTGPFTVPGQGSITFHFAVDVSMTPGEYFNTVMADAPSYAVAPAEDTAEIDVGGPGLRAITLQTNKTSVPKGRRVVLSGMITGDDACLALQTVEIRAKTSSSGYKLSKSVTTDESGFYFTKIRITATKTYQAVAPPSGACKKARSDTVRIRAR